MSVTRPSSIRAAAFSGVAAAMSSWLYVRHVVHETYRTYYHEILGPDRAATVDIAEPATALTFARIDRGSTRQLLLVRSYRFGVVTGVILTGTTDPITAFAEFGYAYLRDIAEHPDPSVDVEVAADDLSLVFDGQRENIAMGTNYPEHGAETSVSSAFLFPKVVQPTGPHTSLTAGPGLLDYEVDLGLVPLVDLHAGETDPSYMGLVLTNDWTGGAGFTNAKSHPGYLTTGDLFVVPADWQRYYRDLCIELYVDGRLRQRGTPADQLWDPTAMLEQIWAHGDTKW